ncbi:alanine racemase [Legionella worsleiensis]|uniref:Bifunctional aspartate kinase/diaminopimelate decarboxylase protein n=1 Tax=Legionella worsleiensis TaxID=45076 RepID=A0A0W1AAQ8_9GAMM|nr:alanine racemase [Legionella worsleiensis]KTD78240.1 bifunctional aspartate kinase/diaminopimelate decarboxylase protein [Legionella worsleiensis]STY32577.1 aspartokinase [Legionella worsleiensis]
MEAPKKTWSKPAIIMQQAGGINMFNGYRDEFCQSHIDGVAILPLLEHYHSPLFILSERRIRENVRHLMRIFRALWPEVIHAWPYKTNYLSAVCHIFHQEGSWAEVVSDFEYAKAKLAGVPGSHIILNGPYKSPNLLKEAIQDNAYINIDHFDELLMIEQIAKDTSEVVHVGIRLNFNNGYTEPWTRFGFNIENGEAMRAVLRIGTSKHLELTGLHCHIGTFVLDTRAYAEQVRIMCDFMEAAERAIDCRIGILDIGGGFASFNALRGIYLSPEQIVPGIEQYAQAIINSLKAATAHREAAGKPLPRLILETGRAVIDDAECLITRVVGNKRLPDGRRGCILDSGVNLMFTSFWYNHRIKPLRPLAGISEETVLYGSLCMNLDVINSSVLLPPLNVGEPLMITNTGAYNNTQWMQFIQYRPSIIMIMEQGSVEIIRDAEQLETLQSLEHVPASLKEYLSKDKSGTTDK